MIDATWPGAVLGPFGECISFVGDELAIAGCTKRALTTLEYMPKVLAHLVQLLEQNGADTSTIRQLIWESPDSWAVSERQTGYLKIHQHSFLAMWGAIEAAIEKQFVLLLCNEADAYDGIRQFLGKSVPRPAAVADENTARSLFQVAKHKLNGSYRFAESSRIMFKLIGTPLSLDAKYDEVLNEAKEVRNCIAHRGGQIDAKAVARVPSLAGFLGQRFQVTAVIFDSYNKAIEAFMLAASNDAIKFATAKLLPNVPTNSVGTNGA